VLIDIMFYRKFTNRYLSLPSSSTPTKVTEDEFRTYFAQFGELQDAIVMFDRETKCSRGFGFVTYVDEVRIILCVH
jgi:RNA recognition motif-containing protein